MKYSNFCILTACAYVRSEKESWEMFFEYKDSNIKITKKQRARFKRNTCNKLWFWACKRWKDFPDIEYKIRNEI